MTDEQKQKYLEHHGVLCPFCESSDIVGDSVDIDEGGVTQYVTCSACGKGWTDVYKLTNVEEMK